VIGLPTNGGVANGGMANGGTANGGVSGGGTANGGAPDSGIASGGASGSGTSSGGATSGVDSGAAGVSTDSGVDSGRPVTFPTGGVISRECAECVNANCQDEARTCHANPACWNMGACVTTCFLPLQCAACFVGDQQARSEFSALQCCSMRDCSMCPSLGGLVACP
jgi:hypothetical protein